MRRLVLLLLLLMALRPSLALAQTSGEYKAFTYTSPLGCLGLTTEQGGIPDCYDANQFGARYVWSQNQRQYVPAPLASLVVANLPACNSATYPATQTTLAFVTDSNNACSGTVTGGGSTVCLVSCSGNLWTYVTGGGGGVTPGGNSGQVQFNNAGTFGGFTVSGDCTVNTGTGVITCTKTNGTAFGSLATASTPLSVVLGGSGSSSPSLISGTGITVSGTWPNQTITSIGSGTVASGTGPAIAQYNSGTSTIVGPVTVSGDATIAQGGALTVTKTNGTPFGALATLGIGANLTSNGGNLTTSGVSTGYINVKDPQYGAVGNGSTDDTAAIQAAINAACAAGGATKRPAVYLPPTPNNCYLISSPILQNCSMAFTGQPGTSTSNGATICQNYIGPTILVQAAEAGYKPPLASSISAVWQSSHSYAQWAEILDSNGNPEVETAAACTSGSGSPLWVATQGNQVTDNTCTWRTAMIGTQLASGTGTALDVVSREFWPGAGTGSNAATTELGQWGGLNDGLLNGLGAFDVRFYFNNFFQTTGGGNLLILGIGEHAIPNQSAITGLTIYLQDAVGSCTHDCVQAQLNIGGSLVNLQPNTSNANATLYLTHLVEISYDGTNARLFLDGVLIKTTAASGTWTLPAYSTTAIADRSFGTYPAVGFSGNTILGYMDSLQVSNVARNTVGYTPPTAKFTTDANTLWLMNFPTSQPVGTLEAYDAAAAKNVFIPKGTSLGGAEVNPGYLGNLTISGGIYANWANNFTFENLAQFNGSPTCLSLNDNDFVDRVKKFYCSVTGGALRPTTVGFTFLNQANNNEYSDLSCDGQQTCVEMATGSGTVSNTYYAERGVVIYPIILTQTQAKIDGLWLDIEDSATHEICSVYANGNYATSIINTGQMTVGTAASGHLCMVGGSPVNFNNILFGGNPTDLVDVITAPTSQVIFRDTSYSSFTYWAAAKAYSTGNTIIDSNGNIEVCTTGGTSAASTQPTWATTVGSTTADGVGALVWTLKSLRTNASNGQYLSILNGNKAEETFVAGLPACAAINRDVPWDINDCTTCTYGSACTGSGTTFCHEICTPAGTWLAQ